jgi:hypothetical protein
VGGTSGALHGEIFVGSQTNSFIVKYQANADFSVVTREWTRQLGDQTSNRAVVYDGIGGIYTLDAWNYCADQGPWPGPYPFSMYCQ